MGIWDEGITSAVPGLLTVLGAAAAAAIVLPALAGISRPLAKAAIRLYFEVADDVREVVAHHQPQRRKSPNVALHLLGGGAEELVMQGLEAEAEDTVAETVVTMVAEIL